MGIVTLGRKPILSLEKRSFPVEETKYTTIVLLGFGVGAAKGCVDGTVVCPPPCNVKRSTGSNGYICGAEEGFALPRFVSAVARLGATGIRERFEGFVTFHVGAVPSGGEVVDALVRPVGDEEGVAILFREMAMDVVDNTHAGSADGR